MLRERVQAGMAQARRAGKRVGRPGLTTFCPIREIRLRADQLYEARGREDGYELDDWLSAEEELAQKKVRTIAA
jgi:DNA invertase Pin-like site-specific DNA recombinase